MIHSSHVIYLEPSPAKSEQPEANPLDRALGIDPTLKGPFLSRALTLTPPSEPELDLVRRALSVVIRVLDQTISPDKLPLSSFVVLQQDTSEMNRVELAVLAKASLQAFIFARDRTVSGHECPEDLAKALSASLQCLLTINDFVHRIALGACDGLDVYCERYQDQLHALKFLGDSFAANGGALREFFDSDTPKPSAGERVLYTIFGGRRKAA